MLPLTTVKAGSGVFNAARKPRNNPKTTATTKTMATTVLKYSFFKMFLEAVKWLPLSVNFCNLYVKGHG
jgi:hypothetical protein